LVSSVPSNGKGRAAAARFGYLRLTRILELNLMPEIESGAFESPCLNQQIFDY